jgi:hypothetical protein
MSKVPVDLGALVHEVVREFQRVGWGERAKPNDLSADERSIGIRFSPQPTR